MGDVFEVKPIKVIEGVFLVGGAGLSDDADCCVYLIDADGRLVLIDSGVGVNTELIVENIEDIGYSPENIEYLVGTHRHIDHIGGNRFFKDSFDCKIIMHELDAEAVESGDQFTTGAMLYGVKLNPCRVDVKISQTVSLPVGDLELKLIHTPGHTPGSISVLLEKEGKRILFGQDIHGPIDPSWGSDIKQYCESMKLLLSLNADILCEGHFGVFSSPGKVKSFIERYMHIYGC
ncbi:MAG: MBL fold metallo-hydrolase [Candidatus Jordarchaeales archaeon]